MEVAWVRLQLWPVRHSQLLPALKLRCRRRLTPRVPRVGRLPCSVADRAVHVHQFCPLP